MKCCVFTRDFYEEPYLDFFIEHYVKLGFDKIIILKTDNEMIINYGDKVDIHVVPNMADATLTIFDNIVKNSDYDWILNVDTDEILLLKYHNNIKDYIKEKLQINNMITTFYFRWAMLEKLDNDDEYLDFNDILKHYTLHNNGHIKSMVKRINLDSIIASHICKMNRDTIMFENELITKQSPNNHKYISNNVDGLLIHMHTRSIDNIFIKSLVTLFNGKEIKDNDKKIFIESIDSIDDTTPETTIHDIFNIIGAKAKLPFGHITENKINDIIDNFITFNYSNKIINKNKEKIILNKLLHESNINHKKLYYFVNRLNKYIIENKFFINH